MSALGLALLSVLSVLLRHARSLTCPKTVALRLLTTTCPATPRGRGLHPRPDGPGAPVCRHTVGQPAPQFSSAKIQKELGFKFLELKTTLKDMATKMAELKLLPKLD